MNPAELDWRMLTLGGAAVVLAAWGGYALLRRPSNDAEEAERRRRAHLNKIGRIVEGHIMEITEVPREAPAAARGWRIFSGKASAPAAGDGTRTLVHYHYSISGVTYETAQDITGLEARACLDKLISGQPVSVKYDPANPGNSILIADDWSGLH